MENKTFEDYWESNKGKYIEEAQVKAQEEFTRLSSKFEAIVSINAENYFTLDIEHSFNLYDNNEEDLVSILVEKLTNANIVSYNLNTARFGSGDEAKKNIAEHWAEMRDFIIENVEGSTYTLLETAGVETMSVDIKELN